MSWTAIILAGERPGESAFAVANGVKAKALIRVGGEPMLGRVARTLLDVPAIGSVVILAQDPNALLDGELAWLAAHPRVRTARGGSGISNSILAVAGSAEAPWPVLVATADHPLLTRAIIEDFLGGVGDADVAFAVVERRVVEAAIPATRRTWLRFRGGAYTGANLFVLGNARARAVLALWARVERDRKKALRILLFFGPLLALRALTRTITLDHALATAARRLKVTATAVRLSSAEAAVDVDKQADLDLVERLLAAR